MKQHVRTFIQNCPCCQKLSAKDPKINASHFATSNYAIFVTLNVDFIGPFPDKGYILVIIDTFTPEQFCPSCECIDDDKDITFIGKWTNIVNI